MSIWPADVNVYMSSTDASKLTWGIAAIQSDDGIHDTIVTFSS